jgi:hypothetical protein
LAIGPGAASAPFNSKDPYGRYAVRVVGSAVSEYCCAVRREGFPHDAYSTEAAGFRGGALLGLAMVCFVAYRKRPLLQRPPCPIASYDLRIAMNGAKPACSLRLEISGGANRPPVQLPCSKRTTPWRGNRPRAKSRASRCSMANCRLGSSWPLSRASQNARLSCGGRGTPPAR